MPRTMTLTREDSHDCPLFFLTDAEGNRFSALPIHGSAGRMLVCIDGCQLHLATMNADTTFTVQS